MNSLTKILVAALLLVFATGISAQPGPGNGGMGRGKALMAKKLNLTADQQKKIDELRTEHQRKMIDLHADIAKLQLDKKEMLKKGNYDRKTFLALDEKIMKQRNVIETARANHQMDVYELLDANQKEIWNSRPMGQGMGKAGKMGRGMRRNMDCPNMKPGR
ncbi:MAG: periplasmic heavy metal sensor [Ignavibacteriaceae bacterium]|jgi:Spy/CpxP family protein refolding chaperone